MTTSPEDTAGPSAAVSVLETRLAGACFPSLQVTVGSAPASPPIAGSASESVSIVPASWAQSMIERVRVGDAWADGVAEAFLDDPEQPASVRQAAAARAVRVRDVRRT